MGNSDNCGLLGVSAPISQLRAEIGARRALGLQGSHNRGERRGEGTCGQGRPFGQPPCESSVSAGQLCGTHRNPPGV